jgi:4-amino-4-deoxy-L-arabinose transferase-like glycosyltransferase
MASIDDRRRPDVAVVLLALFSLPLFFYGLGATYLWQDEAQTALLGRSVLAHGIPMVGRGAESLSAVKGADEGIRGIYFQISWLQAYVEAASFAVLGQSSWSARAPFAAAGWLCIPLVAWAMRQAGGSLAAARIAALLTALNISFIVVSRQARYYALTAAITVLVTGTYAALSKSVKEDRTQTAGGSVGFLTAASLLIFCFDITAIGVLGLLAMHWALTSEDDRVRWSRAFWIPWVMSCLLLAAWITLSLTAASRRQNAGLSSLPRRFRHGGFYYLGQINAHIAPFPVLASLAALWRRSTGAADSLDGNRHAALLFAAVALGGTAGALLSPLRFFRYIVPILPVLLGLLAIGLASLWSLGRMGKALAAAALVMLITSNVLYVWSHSVLALVARSSNLVTVRERAMEYDIPMLQLLQEFRDPPRGPIAATVEYLRQHAGAKDVLVTTYGDLPLKFHTDLKVYGGETAQLPPAEITAHWIWPRKLKVYQEVLPVAEWIERELSRGIYRLVQLPAIDRRWENREDPEEHIFSNPGPEGPPVTIYRLSKGAE